MRCSRSTTAPSTRTRAPETRPGSTTEVFRRRMLAEVEAASANGTRPATEERQPLASTRLGAARRAGPQPLSNRGA